MGFEPTPPFLKVRFWWGVGLGVAVAVIITLAGRRGRPGFLVGHWGWLKLFVPVSIGLLLWVALPFRSLSRLLQRGELPCWACGYNLSATGATGRCPECGKTFVAEGLRKRWVDAERKGSR